MFVRVLKEDKRLREIQATKSEAARKINQGTKLDSVVIPAAYAAPLWTEGVAITIDPLDACDMPDDYHLDIYNFLKTAKWQPTTEGRNGSSWLELLARYRQLGGQPLPKAEDNPLARIPSLGKQLAAFTLACKQVTNTYITPQDRSLFRPARSKDKQLKQYGITNHLPCVSAILCLSRADASGLHERLTQLKEKLNAAKPLQLHAGNTEGQTQEALSRTCTKVERRPCRHAVSKVEEDDSRQCKRKPCRRRQHTE